MKFRFAKKSDKEDVLKFCVNTFDWGDYIDQVWDLWFSDSNGALIVAENNIRHIKGSVIAVSHVSLCPNRKNIWLEGIRVNPDYRRRSIATELLSKMLSYGKLQGAKEASAIVGVNNLPSQLMMENNGFNVISKWNYYSIDKVQEFERDNVRTAAFSDIKKVWDYLKQSQIYKSSGKRYVNSWRWYSFDSQTLSSIIKDGKLLISGNDVIEGIAIINKDGYWNKNDVYQIVYLDAASVSSLYDLIGFVISLVHSGNDRYKRIQIFSPQIRQMSSLIKELDMHNSEQFLLYRKTI
ncbi:MAG: putative GCN5-related N-acetyltransferase [Nitrososphaeraceae archaeon]|nr:putative GCN5-related N-acetyltransferase [Nitrososphaeraceae archaeon]